MADYCRREELAQAELAQKIGVPQRHLSERERGNRTIGMEMAKRLANALRTH